MGQQLSTNTFTSSTWIVNSNASKGTHTTLAGAMASASSGDTILLQTSVTENVTLTPGVNITGYSGAAFNPNVSITGTLTMTGAGSCTLYNLNLITNSAPFLTVSGSAASIVTVRDCLLSASNNTGISYSSSSASSAISIINCRADIATTTIALYSMSSAGLLDIRYLRCTNTGATTTASSNSAGIVQILWSLLLIPLATSSTGILDLSYTDIVCSAVNATSVTSAGTGTVNIESGGLTSGTASALSVGAGTTVNCYGAVIINSTNTNAITGAGTLNAGPFTFTNTSHANNVTTYVDYTFGEVGVWTPTLQGGSTGGSTTYTVQNGYYTKIGNAVTLWGILAGSAATGTGIAVIGGFPFTVKNQTNYSAIGTVSVQNNSLWTYPAGTTMTVVQAAGNTTSCSVSCTGSAAAAASLVMANAAFSFLFTLTYQV